MSIEWHKRVLQRYEDAIIQYEREISRLQTKIQTTSVLVETLRKQIETAVAADWKSYDSETLKIPVGRK